MNYEQTLTLLPDAELPDHRLRNLVYCKLHKAFCDLRHNRLGISFPDFKDRHLGRRIRIHGSQEDVIALTQLQWLGNLTKYVHQPTITVIPDSILGYRQFRRWHLKRSSAQIRRLQKRGHSSALALSYLQLDLHQQHEQSRPFLQLKSNHNQHRYPLYIEMGPLHSEPQEGHFTHFGLAHPEQPATIPWFP